MLSKFVLFLFQSTFQVGFDSVDIRFSANKGNGDVCAEVFLFKSKGNELFHMVVKNLEGDASVCISEDIISSEDVGVAVSSLYSIYSVISSRRGCFVNARYSGKYLSNDKLIVREVYVESL